MKLQKHISKERLLLRLNKRIKCIVEEKLSNSYWARTEHDAPEVDGGIYINTKRTLKIGQIITARVLSCDDYDLYGVYN